MAGPATLKVAGRSDPAYKAAVAGVIESLRSSGAKAGFEDYAGTEGARPVNDVPALVSLVSREKADIAVIDAGELPLRLGRKVEIGAVMYRGNPFNVIVSANGDILDEMPAGAKIVVTEPVLRGQLLNYRDDIEPVDARGDYHDLRSMLDRGEAAAFVARAWEVEMLGRQDEVVEVFTSSICMPPAGQGAVVLLIRGGDRRAAAAVREVNDPGSLAEVGLERMLLGAICRDSGAGVGVLAEYDGEEFDLRAAVVSPDGSSRVTSESHGWKGDELKAVGGMVADLFERGGGEIIDMYRNDTEE
jgi:hydroxymethylbilane synthase